MSGQSSKLSGEVTADFSRLLHGKKRKEGGKGKMPRYSSNDLIQ
jgi:hypothetical protein